MRCRGRIEMTNRMPQSQPLSLHLSKLSILLLLVRAHRQPFIPFLWIILEACFGMLLLEMRSFLCNVGLRKDDGNELCTGIVLLPS